MFEVMQWNNKTLATLPRRCRFIVMFPRKMWHKSNHLLTESLANPSCRAGSVYTSVSWNTFDLELVYHLTMNNAVAICSLATYTDVWPCIQKSWIRSLFTARREAYKFITLFGQCLFICFIFRIGPFECTERAFTPPVWDLNLFSFQNISMLIVFYW